MARSEVSALYHFTLLRSRFSDYFGTHLQGFFVLHKLKKRVFSYFQNQSIERIAAIVKVNSQRANLFFSPNYINIFWFKKFIHIDMKFKKKHIYNLLKRF